LIVTVAGCKSDKKCLGTHVVQAPTKEDLNRQAVILTLSIWRFVSRLSYLSKKGMLNRYSNVSKSSRKSRS